MLLIAFDCFWLLLSCFYLNIVNINDYILIINVYHPNHRCSHGFNMTPIIAIRPSSSLDPVFDTSGVRTEMQFERITAPSSSLCLPPFPPSGSHQFCGCTWYILIWYDLFVDDKTFPLWIPHLVVFAIFCHWPCSQRMLLVVGLVPESSPCEQLWSWTSTDFQVVSLAKTARARDQTNFCRPTWHILTLTQKFDPKIISEITQSLPRGFAVVQETASCQKFASPWTGDFMFHIPRWTT